MGFLFNPHFMLWCRPVLSDPDPNADPDHAGSGRKRWRGEVWKASAPGTNSTKCVQKRLLDFQTNIRDQEAPGSNPGTPTKTHPFSC